MHKTTHSDHQQIRVPATLDVQAVERVLSELWKQNAGAVDRTATGSLMRARVLNLMVWVGTESARDEVDEVIGAVASAHPCRALVLVGVRGEADQDIEMFVSSRCQVKGVAGASRLCGEQLTLVARGGFTVELPSAATPLLISDLPVFLWWRDVPQVDDKTFARLCRASDRVIIDSADFAEPHADLVALAALFGRERGKDAAISDLNWARLTAWRALLAGFYDVAEYRATLERLSRVRVEYVATDGVPEAITPQALMLAGWLASRLGWRIAQEAHVANASNERDGLLEISLEKEGRRLVFEFQKVEGAEQVKGCVTRVELHAEMIAPSDAGEATQHSFTVSQSLDVKTFETRASVSNEVRAPRVVVCNKCDETELIGRELEILSHDYIYEEAVALAAEMVKSQ
jgi:glucose-6-phosphate dehydrogenase assembly protein OpcA